ncbi:glycosyltransferase family 2 protein [Mucilaginibacter kameinonensis]|uniref:glycosyltransferase family 2 protein n=1 Tax=Mucilaginibacter kameinonensis TaxID=452286 RepID=UPI000EF82925|nr:glycosyltransferase family 2 protein [Mucilaginibacter kameinonensis]
MSLITVIIPVYNVELYIGECIQSLLDQSFGDFDIVIIDDCSPDNSITIAREMLSQQSQIRWTIIKHKKNGGLSASRNTGIKVAEGDYLCFIDSDDWIGKDMFSELIKAAEHTQADAVCCNYYLEYEKRSVESFGGVSDEMIFDTAEAVSEMLLCRHLVFSAWAKIYRKSLFTTWKIEYPVGVYYEDVPTTTQLFLKARKVVAIPYYGYHYRQRGGSIMAQKNAKSISDYFVMIQNVENALGEAKGNFEAEFEYLKMDTYRQLLQILVSSNHDDKSKRQQTFDLASDVAKKLRNILNLYKGYLKPAKRLKLRMLSNQFSYWNYNNFSLTKTILKKL